MLSWELKIHTFLMPKGGTSRQDRCQNDQHRTQFELSVFVMQRLIYVLLKTILYKKVFYF